MKGSGTVWKKKEEEEEERRRNQIYALRERKREREEVGTGFNQRISLCQMENYFKNFSVASSSSLSSLSLYFDERRGEK